MQISSTTFKSVLSGNNAVIILQHGKEEKINDFSMHGSTYPVYVNQGYTFAPYQSFVTQNILSWERILDTTLIRNVQIVVTISMPYNNHNLFLTGINNSIPLQHQTSMLQTDCLMMIIIIIKIIIIPVIIIANFL